MSISLQALDLAMKAVSGQCPPHFWHDFEVWKPKAVRYVEEYVAETARAKKAADKAAKAAQGGGKAGSK